MLLHVLLHLLNLMLGHVADLTLVVTVEIMVVGTNLMAMTMVTFYDDKVIFPMAREQLTNVRVLNLISSIACNFYYFYVYIRFFYLRT